MDMNFWKKYEYPLTIIHDRYDGIYSGGKFLAFPTNYHTLPYNIDGDDIACAEFWDDFDGYVGKGDTPIDAYNNLKDIADND